MMTVIARRPNRSPSFLLILLLADIASSFSDEVIEARRESLERWITILAGHPLLQVRRAL